MVQFVLLTKSNYNNDIVKWQPTTRVATNGMAAQNITVSCHVWQHSYFCTKANKARPADVSRGYQQSFAVNRKFVCAPQQRRCDTMTAERMAHWTILSGRKFGYATVWHEFWVSQENMAFIRLFAYTQLYMYIIFFFLNYTTTGCNCLWTKNF